MFSGYFVQVLFPSRCSAVKLCCLPFSSADKWAKIKQRLSTSFCQNFVILTAHHFSCVYNMGYTIQQTYTRTFSVRGSGALGSSSPCPLCWRGCSTREWWTSSRLLEHYGLSDLLWFKQRINISFVTVLL